LIKYLDEVNDSAKHVLELTNYILAISKKESESDKPQII